MTIAAEPRFMTTEQLLAFPVIIYQPGQEPVLFNATQSIDGGLCLPGLSVRVADLFA